MIETNEQFKKVLSRHKGLTTELDNESKILGYKELGIRLALYYSCFMCQKCGETKELTVHHLITKVNRKFMDKHKFDTIRHYWTNQVILCVKCHRDVHKNCKTIPKESIPEERIKKIKRLMKWEQK